MLYTLNNNMRFSSDNDRLRLVKTLRVIQYRKTGLFRVNLENNLILLNI